MAAILPKRTPARRTTLILTALALITIFPILILGGLSMSLWLSRQPMQWERLSQVGESYGGLSATLSGIALLAITASLLLQSRQARASTVHAIRQCHLELARMGIENPRVPMEIWGYGSEAEARMASAANLHLVYWAMLADLDAAEHDSIRGSAANFFRVPAVQDWWSKAGETWLLASSPKVRAVAAIVQEEYERARSDALMQPSTREPPARMASALLAKLTQPRAARMALVVGGTMASAISMWSIARKRAQDRRRSLNSSR